MTDAPSDEQIKHLRDAHRRVRSTLIANADLLSAPFTDAPDKNPWDTFVRPAMRELQGAVKAVTGAADDQPTEPRTFSDGGVDDIRHLYALQHAITDAGGELTRDVHKAIDALRAVWDRELRSEQMKALGLNGGQP